MIGNGGGQRDAVHGGIDEGWSTWVVMSRRWGVVVSVAGWWSGVDNVGWLRGRSSFLAHDCVVPRARALLVTVNFATGPTLDFKVSCFGANSNSNWNKAVYTSKGIATRTLLHPF